MSIRKNKQENWVTFLYVFYILLSQSALYLVIVVLLKNKLNIKNGYVTFHNDGKVCLVSTEKAESTIHLKELSNFELGETKIVNPYIFNKWPDDTTTISAMLIDGTRIELSRNHSHPNDNLKIIAALKNAHAETKETLEGYI
jgi:protein tyrosine phosphatase